MMDEVSRRALVTATAWSVPTVLVAVSAPLAAASTPSLWRWNWASAYAYAPAAGKVTAVMSLTLLGDGSAQITTAWRVRLLDASGTVVAGSGSQSAVTPAAYGNGNTPEPGWTFTGVSAGIYTPEFTIVTVTDGAGQQVLPTSAGDLSGENPRKIDSVHVDRRRIATRP